MSEARDYLMRQFDLAWQLASYHLDGLTTEECLWRPAREGLHVHRREDGGWDADWPDRESYDLGPPSIGWVTWHLGFWWSMVLDHSFGPGDLTREKVRWPGSAEGVREWVGRLQQRWRTAVAEVSDGDLRSHERSRWPMRDRPFGDVIAWATVELTKNASEIGYARFLYATRDRSR